MLDLIIRNGTIVDGSGLPGYRGDVGVVGGRIVSVGRLLTEGRRVIDAGGRVVAPGFVDPHTHVDAQLLFDPYVFPHIEHGVTTVVTGNCSLSMAPVRPAHRDRFSRMFRLIEEMPAAAFEQGVDWRWGEGFGDLVDVIAKDVAVNVAPLVGHSVLRLYVMGDDARRAATADEIRAMGDALRVCLDAGAVGLSTSYVDMEDDMRPVPCRWADHRELDALSAVLGERGRMLQVVHEFYDAELTVSRVEVLGDLSRRYGIPTTLSPLFHTASAPTATDQVMEAVEKEWANGARSVAAGADATHRHQLDARAAQHHVPRDPRLVVDAFDAGQRREARRAHRSGNTAPLIEGLDALAQMSGGRFDAAGFVVREVVLERNRHLVGCTLGEIASKRASTPAETLIDLAVEEELGTWFIRSNIGHVDTGPVGSLLAHPYVHIGASDAGAHVGSFATYGDTGHLFSQYVRGTGALRLEQAVKKITSDTCAIWGLAGRGLVRDGYAADLVVFDPATIDRGPEVASDDFPGEGTRWIRHSVGIDSVIVNGTETWNRDEGYLKGARAGVTATR